MPQVFNSSPGVDTSSDGIAMPIWWKDPLDINDYTLDWTPIMVPGDTIVAVTYTVAPALELSVLSSNFTNDGSYVDIDGVAYTGRLLTSCWLQGGVVGESYEVRALIVMASGVQEKRSFQIEIGQN